MPVRYLRTGRSLWIGILSAAAGRMIFRISVEKSFAYAGVERIVRALVLIRRRGGVLKDSGW